MTITAGSVINIVNLVVWAVLLGLAIRWLVKRHHARSAHEREKRLGQRLTGLHTPEQESGNGASRPAS
jgi:hypothetical protein